MTRLYHALWSSPQAIGKNAAIPLRRRACLFVPVANADWGLQPR